MNCWKLMFQDLPPNETVGHNRDDFCPDCGWLWHQCACDNIPSRATEEVMPQSKRMNDGNKKNFNPIK